jgi:integrase/recombinase XerC
MSHYTKSLRAPRCFTAEEAQRLLDATGRYADTFQTHVIFSLAFGMGLRVHEIAALNVGDVFTPEGAVRRRWGLRVFKGCRKEGAQGQEVLVPDALVRKLAKLREHLAGRGASVEVDAPLFASRRRCRMSERHMRRLLKVWLDEAGLDATLRFHEMRHSALTSFYGRCKDVVLAQRYARHADVRTTMRYLHSTDEAMAQALRGQVC